MKLEELRKGMRVEGLVPSGPVTIRDTDWMGDLLEVVYRTSAGETQTEMLSRDYESRLNEIDDMPAFNASAADFRLGLEARRMQLAHFFDPMMAVHTADIEPLPHQVDAVYGCMLPQLPLKFLLADDPGAGKTIMAGLLIQELLVRGDVERVLIVSPGGLSPQWQQELDEKFGLDFELFSKDWMGRPDPFQNHNRVICRLDQVARQIPGEDEEEGPILTVFKKAEWDLVIVDEAHKLSARWDGEDIKRSKRYRLGEILSQRTRHLLLMTATPHSGKEDDYQLFLCLLDGDRFYGKSRDASLVIDRDDIMRRMIKEKMVRFDGTPLFPPRTATTISYKLSDLEVALYNEVTQYVREQMNRAERLRGDRRVNVGFALTALQRRLASSPEAIFRSLDNRLTKLEKKLREAEMEKRGGDVLVMWQTTKKPASLDDLDDDEGDLLDEEVEEPASTAETIKELEAEIEILKGLKESARKVVDAGEDRKWSELSKLIQEEELLKRPDGGIRKLIVFTEHRHTLNYLIRQISGVIGDTHGVVQIHGGTPRDERKKVQELFRNDNRVRVLVATDAAGEGVNLQCANLMVNYDLPWNPNRLEQRFGRIHRIGQKEVCHLWNMLAENTREHDVFDRLLEKLQVEREALGGDVFNVLGELFQETSLQNLLLEAIKLGESPEVQEHFKRKLEGIFDMEKLKQLIEKRALGTHDLGTGGLERVHHEMEKARARKLLPGYVRTYFEEAFSKLNGTVHQREPNRYEIKMVPQTVRDAAREIGGNIPVTDRYSRICFSKEFIRLENKEVATLVHPGHPLFQSVNYHILRDYTPLLSKGCYLIDRNDPEDTPRLLVVLEHKIHERTAEGGQGHLVSQRLQFNWVYPDGRVSPAGWAPHLDLDVPSDAEIKKGKGLLPAGWPNPDSFAKSQRHASASLAQEHFDEVQKQRKEYVKKLRSEVRARLTAEVTRLWAKHDQFKIRVDKGTLPKANLDNIKKKINELEGRQQRRERELSIQEDLLFLPPVVVAQAIVLPSGLLEEPSPEFCADAEARARIEKAAMNAVMDKERQRGYHVKDVSADKCGWDVTSLKYSEDGRITHERHIEVKGRAKGQETVTVHRNEVIHAINQEDKFFLAVVIVDGLATEGPFYIKSPFGREPGWAEISVTLQIKKLLEKAENER